MRPKSIEKEQAIKTIALELIANEGLENLSMQKLAKAANISPRTIYLKYTDKEDLLIKLFIEEVLGAYEEAVLSNFDETMDFTEGVQLIWLNSFNFFIHNKPSFALMRYGKSSPLLNKAFQQKNIKEGQFFSPIHRFLEKNAIKGIIKSFPPDIYRALLFSPIHDLINEYFDHADREQQIINEEVILACCDVIVQGILIKK